MDIFGSGNCSGLERNNFLCTHEAGSIYYGHGRIRVESESL